ncbi:MAG: site-specific DNA-methyltransferase, partial [Candidatus Lokiarchaeota archaeon]|nr:site-specific DNA-methyltransferase [Candidatus Lokiarchaeota archaeon]
LRRIILASTDKGDLVADFFCGSGTTLTVAEKLGRKWIGCDSNMYSIHMIRKRILNVSKSNDIINWKKIYNKDPNSFNILGIDKRDEKNSIPKVFISKDIRDKQKIRELKGATDFKVKIHQDNKKIKVELIDYSISFEDFVSDKIKENIKSYSDWIDYWSIDFNSKNDIFKNMFFSYRTPKIRTLSLKSDLYNYKESGSYKVSVKIIDIFGIETIKSYVIQVI